MSLEKSFDHAYGCLLGAAVGDAAGAVLEFKGVVASDVTAALIMPGGGVFNVGPGQITDDTELLLALASRLIGRSPKAGLPLDAVAQAYSEWAYSEPFDMGYTCSMAFSGEGGDRAGGSISMMHRARNDNMDSEANGALMRVAPIAVWAAALPESAIIEAARADALLSHPCRTCQDVNALFCVALAHLVMHPGDAEGAVSAAEDLARSEDIEPKVAAWLLEESRIAPDSCKQLMGHVRWAFVLAFAALRQRLPFQSAIEWTLLRGGDTDTNAAIVGAMMGALHGAQNGIPESMSGPVLAFDPVTCSQGIRRPALYAPSRLHELTSQLVLL